MVAPQPLDWFDEFLFDQKAENSSESAQLATKPKVNQSYIIALMINILNHTATVCAIQHLGIQSLLHGLHS